MTSSNLDIVIRTIAQGDGAQVTTQQITALSRAAAQGNAAAAEALNKLQAVQSTTTESSAALAAGARELNAGLHAATATTEAKSAALARLAVAGAAVTAAFAVAKHAVEAFAEKQQAVVSLDAALANQGLLVDEVRVKYQGLADELESLTNIDDQKWINALATLSKFDAKPEQIEAYADAVKNLAGFIGGDVESAAFMFGKAMQGNFAMLQRYGIQVDESATQTEKLNQVMEQLAQRGGGQLEARAKSLSGGFAGLKIATGNLWEGFGNLISRSHVVEVALNVISGSINGLASLFPTLTEKVGDLENKFRGAGGAVGEMADSVETAQKKIKEATDEANASLEKQIKNIIRLRALNDSLNDQDTAGKLAGVDAKEAKGELQPYQANIERAKIRREAEGIKLNNEQMAARGTLNAAHAQRKGATGATDTADAAADQAQQRLADEAAGAGLDPDGLKFAFQKATRAKEEAEKKVRADEAAKKSRAFDVPFSPREKAEMNANTDDLGRANDEIAAIQALNALKHDAAAKEQAYQAAVQKEKGIFESTAGAIQGATDALTVLEAKWKTFTAGQGADQAKGQRAVFDELAKFYKDVFGIEIEARPVPAPAGAGRAPAPQPISAAEQANKTRWKKEDEESKRKQNQNQDRLRMDDTLDGIKRNPVREPAPASGDFGALDSVAESTSGLASGFSAFAEKSVAAHQTATSRLEQLATKIDNVETRLNNLRIS